MSFGGSTAAANQSIKANAKLRQRDRPFVREHQHEWGAHYGGVEQTATDAARKRLREQYDRATRRDRRREWWATLLGVFVAIAIAVWVYAVATAENGS